MITRHHVALTILRTLILCSALVPSDPILILVICAGACTGAILPDFQMKKPNGFQCMTIAWAVSRFTSILVTPLLCRLYHSMDLHANDLRDKRLTHSVPEYSSSGRPWQHSCLSPPSSSAAPSWIFRGLSFAVRYSAWCFT